MIVPIKENKVESWRKWCKSLDAENKSGWDEMNNRYGLSRHDVWLAETPSGPAAVVLHEGPGADSFMEKLGQSDDKFDTWLKENIGDFHGMDFDAPPPGPMPERII